MRTDVSRDWINGYGRSALGQIHIRQSAGGAGQPPLVCLHPVPYSGIFFETLANRLPGTSVIAPDLPGYGRSDALSAPASIEAIAGAISEALEDVAGTGPFDVLGYHTGALVAAQLASALPSRVNRLVFCGVPYFSKEDRAARLEKVARPVPISEELHSLHSRWTFSVESRADGVPLNKGFALFREALASGENDWFGFDAAFRFDPTPAFDSISHQTLFLVTSGALEASTRAAAARVKNAKVKELLHLGVGAFEIGAVDLAAAIQRFLVRS